MATRIETVPAKYDARDPLVCPSKREPTQGAPSPEQARRYFLCHRERELDDFTLWLFEDVKVEIGKGRPYSPAIDRYRDIDPEETVYPIRGRFTHYACRVVFYGDGPSSPRNVGQNCTVTPTPNATGECYRDTFGDWQCNMSASSSGSSPQPLRGLYAFPR